MSMFISISTIRSDKCFVFFSFFTFLCHCRCKCALAKMKKKFCATTKLNRFIQGRLKMGRKSHQFGILFSESIYNFLVSHLSATFSICSGFFLPCTYLNGCVCVCIVNNNDYDDDLDYISIPIFAVGFIQKEIKLFKRKWNLNNNNKKERSKGMKKECGGSRLFLKHSFGFS